MILNTLLFNCASIFTIFSQFASRNKKLKTHVWWQKYLSFLPKTSLRPRQARNEINDTYVLLHTYFLHIICNQTYFKSLLLPWKIALARVMRSIFVALVLCHRCLFYPGQSIFNDITIYYYITYITSTTTYLAYIKQHHQENYVNALIDCQLQFVQFVMIGINLWWRLMRAISDEIGIIPIIQ